MDGTKRCATCGNDLPGDAFYPDKSRRDGLARICKECNRTMNRARYARLREQELQRSREWRLANAERARESDRLKYLRNRELRMEQMRAWAAANPERVAAQSRRWARENREKQLEVRRRSEARRRAARAGVARLRFSPAELDARLAFYGRKCWMCGGPYEVLDHVKPLSRGGPHLLANLRPACADCNGRKHARWPYSPTAS